MQHRTGRNRATRPGQAWMAFWLGLASWSSAQEPEGQSGSPGPPPVAEEAPPSAPKVEPLADPTPPERTSPVESGTSYQFLEDKNALLEGWSASGLVQTLELGTSAGGRELFGVQFGAPGPRPLGERATLLIVGGLDGISLSGSEAVIAVVTEL